MGNGKKCRFTKVDENWSLNKKSLTDNQIFNPSMKSCMSDECKVQIKFLPKIVSY